MSYINVPFQSERVFSGLLGLNIQEENVFCAWRSYTNKTSKSNYTLIGKLETELIFAFI